jgi:catechol 2,3-dioxygenase-like lactoylglutathione lyase family enzyme
MMLNHLGLNVADFDRSKDFYERALAPLGISLIMEPVPGVAGFGEDEKPYFWIARDRGAPQTGVHVAFEAASREPVDAFQRPRSRRVGRTTAAPACARSTTPATTAPTSWTRTATTSRPSATGRPDEPARLDHGDEVLAGAPA